MASYIRKYNLDGRYGTQKVDMSQNPRILHVVGGDDGIVVYAMLDSDSSPQEKEFSVVPDGRFFENPGAYLGTAFFNGSEYHVFG